MTKAEFIEEQIHQLSAEEQLDLAYRVLERNPPQGEEYELSPELRQTLRQRLQAAKETPDASLSWDKVRAGILEGS